MNWRPKQPATCRKDVLHVTSQDVFIEQTGLLFRLGSPGEQLNVIFGSNCRIQAALTTMAKDGCLQQFAQRRLPCAGRDRLALERRHEPQLELGLNECSKICGGPSAFTAIKISRSVPTVSALTRRMPVSDRAPRAGIASASSPR